MSETKEHVNNQVVEIIEELARKKRTNTTERDVANNTNNPAPDRGDNVVQFPKTRVQTEIEETQRKDNPKSLKNLLAAEHNLQQLKKRMLEDPEKNQGQLQKLEKVEKKLNHSILVARQKETNLAINALKQDARMKIIKVGEQLDKVNKMRETMQKNPRFYKDQIQKLDKLETKLNASLGKMQAKSLQTALRHVVNNPNKYRQEIDRYDNLKDQLKTIKKENDNELKVDNKRENNLNNDKENNKENSLNKSNNQEQQLSRSSSRSRDDLELSR